MCRPDCKGGLGTGGVGLGGEVKVGVRLNQS